MRAIWGLAVLAVCGCSAQTLALPPDGDADAGVSPQDASADVRTDAIDAAATLDAGSDAKSDAFVGISDAMPEAAVADAAPDAGSTDAASDAGTVGDASEAGASDAGVIAADGGADAGPCLDFVDVPVTPTWVARAHYTLNDAGTTQSVPYYCPGTTDGNSCKYALGNPAGGKYYPSACHIAVPAQCLPCTGATTSW
jgi:hypothetical protein